MQKVRITNPLVVLEKYWNLKCVIIVTVLRLLKLLLQVFSETYSCYCQLKIARDLREPLLFLSVCHSPNWVFGYNFFTSKLESCCKISKSPSSNLNELRDFLER